jgi:hypothetical protein
MMKFISVLKVWHTSVQVFGTNLVATGMPYLQMHDEIYQRAESMAYL